MQERKFSLAIFCCFMQVFFKKMHRQIKRRMERNYTKLLKMAVSW